MTDGAKAPPIIPRTVARVDSCDCENIPSGEGLLAEHPLYFLLALDGGFILEGKSSKGGPASRKRRSHRSRAGLPSNQLGRERSVTHIMEAHRLTRLLNPRSVAVVGAKKANDYRWLRCASTFQGPVYSVNIDPNETAGIEALGVRNYQRLQDIPGAVDHVIVSVPREVVPIVLRDCIAKRVGGAMLFTSGFSETGTENGTRATASHTGSLAESMVIWRSVMRQTGVIEVDSLEEMVDTIKTLLYVPPTCRDRVALISMTGGQSVVTTDAFAKAGLQVPTLSAPSYTRLERFFNIVGGSYRNPIDMGSNWEAGPQTREILDILEEDPQVDIIAFELSLNLLFRRLEAHSSFRTFLLDMLISHKQGTRKPFLAIVTPSYVPEAEEELKRLLLAAGIPNFPTFQRAAKALAGCISYQRFLADL
jgi:acyl-CoA synthetase (NDP forming)